MPDRCEVLPGDSVVARRGGGLLWVDAPGSPALVAALHACLGVTGPGADRVLTAVAGEVSALAHGGASFALVLTDPSGTGNDTLSLTGLLAAAASTGTNLHISTNDTSATFAGSAVSLGGSGRTVTVAVGATCTGTGCSAIGQATASTTLSVVPAATVTDLIGNTAAAVARTFSIRLF